MGRTKNTALAFARREPLAPLLKEKELARLEAGVAEKEKREVSESSKKAYAEDWERFDTWCARYGVQPSKVDWRDVARFLEYEFITPREDGQMRKITGITRTLSGVIYTLKDRYGIDWIKHSKFTVLLSNMRKKRAATIGEARRKATPILRAGLEKMLACIDATTFAGKRDRALLLFGWMGAFRRSEIVELDVADLGERTDEGFHVHLKKAKTDQTGERSDIFIPALDERWCAVRALEVWLDAAKITEGPVFRAVTRHETARAGRLTGHSVSKIVKRLAKKAKLTGPQFSGHSLRRGWACQAKYDGFATERIQRHLRHSDIKTTLLYIAEAIAAAESVTKAMFAPKGVHA